MKKILTSVLAASLMLLGTSAFAQVSVGAGYVNSKNTYTTSSGSTNASEPMNGFYVGVDYNVPIGDIFGMSAGVNYEFLTSKDYELGSFLKGKYTEQYINVPVRLNAGFGLADGVRLFVFGGPTFSYGLSAQSEGNVSVAGIDLGGKYDNYQKAGWNRFDVMVGGGAGLDLMDKIRLTVGYDLGMFNRLPKDSSDKLNRNKLHAGIAFLF